MYFLLVYIGYNLGKILRIIHTYYSKMIKKNQFNLQYVNKPTQWGTDKNTAYLDFPVNLIPSFV